MKLGVIALLWAGAAWAQEPLSAGALPESVRGVYLEAHAFQRAGEPAKAIAGLREVLSVDPRFLQARLDLGLAYEALAQRDRAREVYESCPFDAACIEALGRLELAAGEADRAARIFAKLGAAEPARALSLQAHAYARSQPEVALALLDELLLMPPDAVRDAAPAGAARAVAEALLDAGRVEEALFLVGRAQAVVEEPAELLDLEALSGRLALEVEARRLALAGGLAPSPSQAASLAGARAELAAGGAVLALGRADGLIAEAPRLTEAYLLRADACLALGQPDEAERALSRAVALDPRLAAPRAQLAELLLQRYGGRRDGEALRLLAEATRDRPTQAGLWASRARVERGLGLLDAAAASWAQAARNAPLGGALAGEAQRELEALRRAIPPAGAPGVVVERPTEVPESAWWAYYRAQVYAGRGQVGEALSELALVRLEAPEWVEAALLQARLYQASGEVEEAERAWREALALRPDAPGTLMALADLAMQRGDVAGAVAMRERAADSGDAEALLLRARAQLSEWRLLAVGETLALVRAASSAASLVEQAEAVEAERRLRLGGLALAGAGLPLLAVGLPLWRRRRARAGVGLDALLLAAPRAGREVAARCAALRHEVIRHHLVALAPTAAALREGERDAGPWLASRLYGPDGALARVWAEVAALEALGRAHQLRLNLRWRDPLFGPFLEAVSALEAAASGVRVGRVSVAPVLERAGEACCGEVQRGLSALVARAGRTELERGLVLEAWRAVCAEPAFAEAPEVGLRCELDAPLWVRAWRDDLHVALVNLMRNARAAGASQLVVRLDAEEDDVTGLLYAALRVADDAPGTLTTEMIRGRFIDRGLGLAVDLVARHGGSVHVEAEAAPLSKAVVLRFACVEET